MMSSVIFLVFLLASYHFTLTKSQLKFDYYSKSCPAAEKIVQNVVRQAIIREPANAAILLRLQFHDCFVEGCDGSILLTSDSNDDESFAVGNAGVGGFEVIDEAKTELERSCPGIVSCADIVVLAARDSIVEAKGPFYNVETGRRDGLVGNADKALDLPLAGDSFNKLKSKFVEKGLSEKDLVLLSPGSHTIGTAACFFVTPRLDSGDSTISKEFFKVLRSRCPQGSDVTNRVPLDWGSQFVFDGNIFKNIKNGRGILKSDSILYENNDTKKIIDSYLESIRSSNASFAEDYSRAMVKMGAIGVKVGSEGEIRRVCSKIN